MFLSDPFFLYERGTSPFKSFFTGIRMTHLSSKRCPCFLDIHRRWLQNGVNVLGSRHFRSLTHWVVPYKVVPYKVVPY